jgi:predicted nucleotidyltransferase
MTLTEVRLRRQEILDILGRAGAGNVRVFGSVARGDADERSDVDLLVDLAEPQPRGFAYFGLIDELQRELAAALHRPVHVVDVDDPTTPAARKILAEAIPL